MVASGVKLDRLANGTVFLFDSPIVRGYVESVLALLLICLFKLQTDRRNRLRLRSLEQREFKVVSIAAMLEHFEIVPGSGNQSALQTQIADRAF